MPKKETYRPGDHWIISDISGQKIRKSESVKDWRGLIMERENWSPKHPQLTIRPRQEKIAVQEARTQADDPPLQDPPFSELPAFNNGFNSGFK